MKKSISSLSQVSVWLMPDSYAADSLTVDMKDLAQKFSAPLFVPHVTLYSISMPAEKLTNIENSLKEIAKDFKPFKLNVLSIKLIQTLFKSLFLQLESSKELTALYKKLTMVFAEYAEYKLDPHLSLLYKEGLTKEEKTKSLKNISFPSQITFNKVALKISGQNDNFGKDIDRWSYSILN